MMRAMLTFVVGIALAVSGCGSDAEPAAQDQPSAASDNRSVDSPTLTDSPSPTPKAGTSNGTVLQATDSDYGTILFDSTGQAIYLFEKEATSEPECYEECAVAWPPVLTNGSPRATGEVDPGLVDTTQRTDGSTQVTYAGHPLYYYAHEGKNQVLCHNVSEFGGVWLVVTPSGEAAA